MGRSLLDIADPTLYLFDGHNLLHAGGFADQREFRDVLASWVATRGARGVLVFDGDGTDETRRSSMRRASVRSSRTVSTTKRVRGSNACAAGSSRTYVPIMLGPSQGPCISVDPLLCSAST